MIRTIILISSLSIMVVGFIYGKNITFNEQWALYSTLETIASIVFAVVGAWFAIIYPDRLKGIFKGNHQNYNDSGGIEKLFSPVVNSTCILCIVLLIGVVAPILKHIDFFMYYRDYLRRISYSLLVGLTLWQIWTVITTLIPANMVASNLDIEKEDGKKEKFYTNRGKQ